LIIFKENKQSNEVNEEIVIGLGLKNDDNFSNKSNSGKIKY